MSASAAGSNVPVSVISDATPSAPVQHGIAKVVAALRSLGCDVRQETDLNVARRGLLLVAGLASGESPAAQLVKANAVSPPTARESLLIRHIRTADKPTLLVAGGDDRGVMYGLLDAADRIAWAEDRAQPFSAVRDASETPAVSQRALSIYTMQRAYFEQRLHDPAYWHRYFDLMAQNRFNSFVLIFGYENGGFLAPPYPYFFDLEQFPDVRMVGVTPEQQQHNLASLKALIRLAHDRAIDVTLGIWDHIYRAGVQANHTPGTEHAMERPTPHLVWGVNADNLAAYTKAGLARLLELVPELDALQFRMHDESGLKDGEQVAFWHEVFAMLKQQAPNLRFDARAKGLPDAVIEDGLASGIPLRITTKYWMEQMGLPFHPTHVPPQNQHDRRHSYADLLRYPRRYNMHWRLWNGGTARVLLWGDPDYARRFAESSHLYDGDGFEVNEPLCTKMQAQAHDARPIEVLNPRYRYTDYEFERYWHFFQVFGRLGYNPHTPADVWDRQFARRFGQEAGRHIANALHRASAVLPRIVATCYPYSAFPLTRGWAEKQPLGDLVKYASAEGGDVAQFASFDQEAQAILGTIQTAQVRPTRTSRWFQRVAQEIADQTAAAESAIASHRGKEFDVTVVDLKILSSLALFHARRIPAAVAYCLYQRTGDLRALDDAMARERQAIEAWRELVAAAGDVYHTDLAMGARPAGLCGHWRDELQNLETGLAALEQQRRAAPSPTMPLAHDPAVMLQRALADDAAGPDVQHGPITRARAATPLTITATVRSACGVQWVHLRYRPVNQQVDYATLAMLPTGRADEYAATVPADAVSPIWDFMYYIEALDRAGHGTLWPDLEVQSPYVIVIIERE